MHVERIEPYETCLPPLSPRTSLLPQLSILGAVFKNFAGPACEFLRKFANSESQTPQNACSEDQDSCAPPPGLWQNERRMFLRATKRKKDGKASLLSVAARKM